ncbi:MAG: glycosyltransferase family 4 protein [Candidatus Kaiserbacteria bacterium]|nr:glycosyltransferase family 4 protein [Candidatus Kaiserbacteria bacterium]
MKLLITTQSIDKNDPILGFIHGWVVALSSHFETVHIICLREGIYELPVNVHVHSLGKELGVNYVRYLARFFLYVWKYRHEYDVIFSHMNPHYIVLSGWLWRLMGKRMFFWRNHARMNVMTRIAAFFAKRVFYTSQFACTRIFKNARQMPVGINTMLFRPQEGVVRRERSILFLGRLSRVKRPELFIEACKELPDVEVNIYGDEPRGDVKYAESLKRSAPPYVHFHTSVPNHETPALYSAHDIYVNLTPEGSMDKTVLEATACGALVLVSNTSFRGQVRDECILTGDSPRAIATQLEVLMGMSEEEKKRYRSELQTMVQEKHSLEKLVTELVKEFNA